LDHNNILRLFIGRSNGLETAALPLSPLAAILLLTVVLLIVFSGMALIYD
jgi:Ni,Fe-hydrogenase I cytochrome b subunit